MVELLVARSTSAYGASQTSRAALLGLITGTLAAPYSRQGGRLRSSKCFTWYNSARHIPRMDNGQVNLE